MIKHNIDASKENEKQMSCSDYFFVAPLDHCKEQSFQDTYSDRKDAYEILFVTQGFLVRESNSIQIQINPKELYVSLPGETTFLHLLSDAVKGFYCCFSAKFLDCIHIKNSLEYELAYINSFMHRYPVRLPVIAFERISFCFESLSKLYNEANVDYQLIRTYITAIIYEARKILSESAIDPYPSKSFKIAKQYHDLLMQHISKHQNLDFYASLLNITPNHLNKSVKQTTGRTANTILNEIRILEAKIQLKYSDAPIGDIALNLGFNDASYFTKCFKDTTGITPFQYRNV